MLGSSILSISKKRHTPAGDRYVGKKDQMSINILLATFRSHNLHQAII